MSGYILTACNACMICPVVCMINPTSVGLIQPNFAFRSLNLRLLALITDEQ
jgi:hypothetical protein